MADEDRYEAWYSEKLWQLLPGIYRAEDSDDFDKNGPLRELVDRIGAQAAVVRRSIDRLWEDQSIETCDDWLINYFGDLLATTLVASLDARGRRVDVGRTIYYRRRKGTVGLLEELAGDITGWSVRVVEFFRRMERTRHLLDPAIGSPAEGARAQLQHEQGLVGLRTNTRAGGTADLRDVHGASLVNSAFDEYFHTADVRRGRGEMGRYNIPHLGVFVWRLKSFGVTGVTAVRDDTCKNQYTFDPTGRETPLFAAGEHPSGDEWVSPTQSQVPEPIARTMLQASFEALYREGDEAHSLAVHRKAGTTPPPSDYELVEAADVERDPRQPTTSICIDPVRGRVIAPAGTTAEQYRVDYHYGFSSEIGAGPYDRRIPRSPRARPTPITAIQPEFPPVRYGAGLDTQLAALGPQAVGTVWIDDSLTYTAVTDVASVKTLAIRAKNLCRPVIRAAKPAWRFTGVDSSATLELDGLLVTRGMKIVLAGSFAHVKITCCTFDPGSWAGTTWTRAVDSVALDASRIVILGTVRTLEIDRCIVGPVSDDGGAAERLVITDSIVQALMPDEPALALVNSTLELERCTILGGAKLHRLDASESILHDVVTVDDRQHGCMRFTAWASGSKLPRRYESVEIRPNADLFTSRDFGQPGYAQLIAPTTISEGAEDGSEMGAFCREKTAIKERSLLVKYQEYLPLGIEPAIVHVT